MAWGRKRKWVLTIVVVVVWYDDGGEWYYYCVVGCNMYGGFFSEHTRAKHLNEKPFVCDEPGCGFKTAYAKSLKGKWWCCYVLGRFWVLIIMVVVWDDDGGEWYYYCVVWCDVRT